MREISILDRQAWDSRIMRESWQVYLDTSRYKGRSFRIGAASLAAGKGFSDAQIRTLGRWKSDAFKLYIRSERLQAN